MSAPTLKRMTATTEAIAATSEVRQTETNDLNDRFNQKISVCKIAKGAMFIQRDITVMDALEEIRDGTHAAAVNTVRDAVAIYGKDTPEVKTAKCALPAFLFSGKIEGKVKQAMEEGRFHHSGLLQLDFDKLADPIAIREQIATDRHVLAAWLSPSGDGVKGLFVIEPATTKAEHLAAFFTAEAYWYDLGLTLDPACKNSNRLCFASHDPDLKWNEDAVQLATAPPPRTAPKAAAPTKPPTTSPSLKLGINAIIPQPPHNGIHDWIMKGVRSCEQHGMTQADTFAKFKAYDGTLRRPFDHNELENACRDIFATPSATFTTSAGSAATSVQTLNGKTAIELPCPGRPLSDFAEDVGKMLAGAGVYSRGGVAFTVDHATKQLCAVDPQWLRTWAESEVSLFKQAKTSAGLAITLRHSMSLDVARALVVSPQFLAHLPGIKKFSPVRMPVMRADGRIELLPEGFDPETLTLTDPNGCKYSTDNPPELGAKAIRRALAEFPFADERSKAAAVAAMLTVYAGGLLPPASTNPAFIYLANAEGSGKTTLAQLAGIPYGVCEAESKPATEEEWQKTLLALVMGGARLLLLDNLKGHLNSPSFEAYLTATKFSGRILGLNKKFSGEADAVVLLTGNRLTVSPDLRRRCIFVELFMQELRAEDRVFKRRLDAPAILELQPALLTALWCMVRGWDADGRPPASKINSSVPRWSETIAGIVEWAGFACPSVPAELEDGGDTDTRDIAQLSEAMIHGEEMKFSALCELCSRLGLFERFADGLDSDGKDGLKARKGFSQVLKTYSGRFVAKGKRFIAEGKGHQRRYVIR
jgi:hypothetical protein